MTPISCGTITLGINARSCLSVTMAEISSFVRRAAEAPPRPEPVPVLPCPCPDDHAGPPMGCCCGPLGLMFLALPVTPAVDMICDSAESRAHRDSRSRMAGRERRRAMLFLGDEIVDDIVASEVTLALAAA